MTPSVAAVGVVEPGTTQAGWPLECQGPDGVSCQGVGACSRNVSIGPLAGLKSNRMPESLVGLPTESTEPASDAGEALLCGSAYPTTPPSSSMTAPTTSLRLRCIKSRSPKPAMPLQCLTARR